jgi:hypothetical protein
MKSSIVMARLRAGGFISALALFGVVVGFSLYGIFVPGQTLFSNDGPLGQLMTQCHRLPERFSGCWQDLNNVGFAGAAAVPSFTFGLLWLLGPILFSKFYAFLSLVFLGLSAWCFFRQLKLARLACLLGGLAIVLNSTFFSVACWGVGAHDLTIGLSFLALAALVDTSSPRHWLRVILAGMALGMAVTEGADVGAIFSIFVAIFIVYQALTAEGSLLRNVVAGAGRLLLVVVCALFLAAQSIHGLVATSIEGVAGTQQDALTKEQHWNWATQWSLPRIETLNIVVPGVFGYRMDTPNGGIYWGTMGRDPAWQTFIDNGRQGRTPTGFLRYNGGGNYAGGLVVLLGLWAAAQSFRRKDPAFAPAQRNWLWFWLAVAVASLLLALGRFAPFYQLVYALPYFSTIRNPTKFLYLFGMALTVLFAYGVDALVRRYLPAAPGRRGGFTAWWKQAGRFDKIWVYACALVWVGSLLAWWDYAAHRDDLLQYLQSAQVGSSIENVATFAIQQVGWFVVVFFLAASLLLLVISGAFAGRPLLAGSCLTLLLATDLTLANRPWVRFWDYQEKYATNPVIDLLRDKPYDHRVAIAPLDTTGRLALLSKLYQLEWLQHEFPYYNIHSFETVEMPRIPEDYGAFTKTINSTNAFGAWFHLVRAWHLEATRYVLAPAGFSDFLQNQAYVGFDPVEPIASFALERKPGVLVAKRADQVTAVLSTNGPFALFRLTGTLPRAKLYSNWLVSTNDADVLTQLFNPAFDPTAGVFVDGGAPDCTTANAAQSAGTVDYVSYAPKDIVLSANAAVPSVLLLNDHFDPNWNVWVDGHPAKLLRCNFLMRGVQVPPGAHQIEFKFQPPTGWLPVTLVAEAVTVVVLVLLVISYRKDLATRAPTAVKPVAGAKAKAKPQESRKAPGRVAKR